MIQTKEPMNNSPDLQDYLSALRRRSALMIRLVFAIGIVSVLIAYGLTPMYRSTATIQIEKQDIPDSFVQTTVTDLRDQHIEAMTQRVFRASNLAALISDNGASAARPSSATGSTTPADPFTPRPTGVRWVSRDRWTRP